MNISYIITRLSKASYNNKFSLMGELIYDKSFFVDFYGTLVYEDGAIVKSN